MDPPNSTRVTRGGEAAQPASASAMTATENFPSPRRVASSGNNPPKSHCDWVGLLIKLNCKKSLPYHLKCDINWHNYGISRIGNADIRVTKCFVLPFFLKWHKATYNSDDFIFRCT